MSQQRNQPAIVIDSFNLGGIADSPYIGARNSLASIVGFDLHSVPGLMLVQQKLVKDSATTIDDLVKIVPCSDGSTYFFGKTTGKIWKRAANGTYSLEQTIPLSTHTAFATPQTAVDDNSIGTEAWLNPSNVTASDDTYASVDIGSNLTSHYLKATNFGFNLPSTATIIGVEVEVDQFGDQPVRDSTVKLIKGGTITGTNKATSTNWPDPEEAATYGGAEDMWGTTLAYSDVNASNFGVAINVTGTTGVANIDQIRMKIWYTDSAQTASILDAYEYYGYIYYAQAGFFLGRWQVGTAWSTRDDKFGVFTGGNSTYHPMIEANRVLYIGDSQYVAQVDASDGDSGGIFSAEALDIPPEYVVSALGKNKTRILVGGTSTSNLAQTGIFSWDTWSVSFTNTAYIDESGINAIQQAADGTIIIQAGNAGNLYIYDGENAHLFKQIPPSFPSLYTPTATAKVHYPATATLKGIPLIALSNITGNPALQGVYAFGSRNINYPRILTLDFPISTGNVTNVEIWSIAVVGLDLYVSWKDTTSGTVYGVDKLSYTTRLNGAYFETRVMKYSKVMLDNFKKFIVDYNSVPSNTSIALHYKVNHGNYVQFDSSTEFINDTDRVEYRAERDIKAKTLQLKVVVTTSGNTAPTIEDLVLLLQE